ncbi:phage tail protein [Roseomonas marmotae]|uniref:phage tail protein n=1 Tax=Roseomonas marmotae TaxID=2768161 RepID=UPI001F35D0F2|nr:phage tail protein [Roseomonas marmotae]
MLEYIFGRPVMMQLGPFQFGISTAAYQELTRSTEWRWASQDRYLSTPVNQYTGKGADTMTLPGVIYPEYRGGFGQVDAMRDAAEKHEPLTLIAGDGSALGQWIITRVEEKQSTFASEGKPRRIEFTLNLRHCEESRQKASALDAVASAASGSVSIPSQATGAVAQVKGLASSVSSAVKSVTGTLQSAASTAQTALAPYVAIAKDVQGGITRAVEVAADMKAEANRALAVMGVRPLEATALSSARAMVNRAGTCLTRVNSASTLLRGAADRLGQDAPAQAVAAVQKAEAAVQKVGAICRETYAKATKITEAS